MALLHFVNCLFCWFALGDTHRSTHDLIRHADSSSLVAETHSKPETHSSRRHTSNSSLDPTHGFQSTHDFLSPATHAEFFLRRHTPNSHGRHTPSRSDTRILPFSTATHADRFLIRHTDRRLNGWRHTPHGDTRRILIRHTDRLFLLQSARSRSLLRLALVLRHAADLLPCTRWTTNVLFFDSDRRFG